MLMPDKSGALAPTCTASEREPVAWMPLVVPGQTHALGAEPQRAATEPYAGAQRDHRHPADGAPDLDIRRLRLQRGDQISRTRYDIHGGAQFPVSNPGHRTMTVLPSKRPLLHVAGTSPSSIFLIGGGRIRPVTTASASRCSAAGDIAT